MTDETTPVPTALIEELRDGPRNPYPSTVDDIIACLPKPPPTFDDEVCAAFYKALWPTATDHQQQQGRGYLTRLYESGWLVPSDDGSFIIRPPKEAAA